MREKCNDAEMDVRPDSQRCAAIGRNPIAANRRQSLSEWPVLRISSFRFGSFSDSRSFCRIYAAIHVGVATQQKFDDFSSLCGAST